MVKPQVVDDALFTYRHMVLYMFALSHKGGDGEGFRPSQVHCRQWMNME